MKQTFSFFGGIETIIKKFGRDRRGTVAVLAGLTSLPLVAATGLAMDYYRAINAGSQLQNSIDAAALAGAATWGPSEADKKRAALKYFQANTRNPADTKRLEINVDGDVVTVSASTIVKTSFMQVLGIEEVPVHKKAAAVGLRQPVCILSLSANARDAIHFQGSPALVAPECAMHANSRSGSAILGKGNPNIHPLLSSAVGGIAGRGYRSETRNGTPVVDDPLHKMPRHAAEECKDIPALGKGRHRLEAGTYCNLRIGTKADVEFGSGRYVITGDLEVKPNAVLRGSDVFLDLVGEDSTFSLHANATYDIASPRSGPYAETLVRQRGTGKRRESRIYGGGKVTFAGAIYAPNAPVLFQGGIDVTIVTSAIALIVDTVRFQGDATLRVDIADKTAAVMNVATVLAGARMVE